MLKKILVIGFLCSFIIIPTVLAIDLGQGLMSGAGTKAGYSSATGETTFAEMVGLVIKTFLSFVGVIFLVLMVYAGYLWMTARGEEEKTQKSLDIIKAAIIGLIITVAAYSITSFVVPRVVEKAVNPNSTTVAP